MLISDLKLTQEPKPPKKLLGKRSHESKQNSQETCTKRQKLLDVHYKDIVQQISSNNDLFHLSFKLPLKNWSICSTSDDSLTGLEMIAIMENYANVLKKGTSKQLYNFIMDSIKTFKKVFYNSKLISQLDIC
jgi:hypothetical protein